MSEIDRDERAVVTGQAVTQDRLPEALKRGEITQAEVDRIWEQTSFLSAQTPIEFRRAVIAIGGDKLDPLMTLVLSQMMDIRAAMTKDESKFAHLVAGTETIVKTLKNVNPLVERLRRQEELIDSLSDQVNRAEAKIDTLLQAMAEGGKLEIKHQVLTGGDDEAAFLAETAAAAIDSPIAEPTEEPYEGNVGSAWDPKNPAKGPVKLPTAKAEYEEQEKKHQEMRSRHQAAEQQSKEFRERILKHS
jgi:hypothetical protein